VVVERTILDPTLAWLLSAHLFRYRIPCRSAKASSSRLISSKQWFQIILFISSVWLLIRTTYKLWMTIDPRSLRIYLTVCRCGSLSAAARELNMSQPSVSVSIAQLEHAVGTTLFERSRTGITLGRAGHALWRRAEAMETLLTNAQHEIDLLADDVTGPITVGGTPGALASLLPHALRHFTDQHPRSQLLVMERSDAELIALLRKETIDLAIVTTEIDAPPDDIAEETLLRDPFDLIVGKQNDHLPGQIALADMADARWVLPAAIGAFRRQVDALFIATNSTTPNNIIRCDSLITTKSIVRQTDYVTILPREVASAELSIGALRSIRITGHDMLRSVGVRRVAHRTPPPVVEAFLAALRGREYP